jgi:Bacterial membrane protein YfhO
MPSSDRAPFNLAAAVGLFVLAWVVLGAPWLTGQVTIPWDAKAHWYPHLGFAARALHGAGSPLWTPNIFSGSPEIADPQSVLFSAPFLILAALNPAPSLAAMDRAVLAMLLMGGLAIIMIFRDRGWHWGGAVIAAIAIAFGAAASWRIQHVNQVFSLCWWVIAWWLLSRALERRSVLDGLAAGLAAGLMVIGRDQVALLACYLLAGQVAAFWLTGPDRGTRLRASLPPLAAGALAGLAVVTVPVVLSALWGEQSNRIAIDLEGAGRGSLHPAHLLSLAIGNLFGAAGPLAEYWGPPSLTWGDTGLFLARNMGVLYAGALPFLLIVALFASGRAFAAEIRFATISLLVMLVFALGWYTPALQLFWHLPGISLFRRPADAVFLIGGLTAILAGYAAHLVFTGGLRTGWRVPAAFAALVLAAGGLLIVGKGAPASAWSHLFIGLVTLVLSLAALLALPRIRAGLAVPLLAGLLVLDLAVTNGPSESTALPPATYDVLSPDTTNPTVALLKLAQKRDQTRRDRVELLGLGYHWQNAALAHGFEDTLGFNPVRSAAYADLVGAEDIASLPGQRRFPPAFPGYRSVLADILGLRFVVTGVPVGEIDRRLPADALKLIARTDEAYIYENTRALPRVWVAPSAEPTPERLAETGFPANLDPRDTVLIEGVAPVRKAPGGSAHLLRYANSEIVVETETGQGGFLVLADAWHPWWFARIDGREVSVRRAFGLVRAVEVPAGKATVRFTFEPLRGALRQLGFAS